MAYPMRQRGLLSGITRPRRVNWIAYLFMLPTVVLYSLFVLYPFVASFSLSLTDWNGADSVRTFVGFDNYVRLVRDGVLRTALTHNLVWMVVGSAGGIGLGFLLALLVWHRPRGFVLFRTVFFLPQVLGAAVVGIIWKLIYRPYKGLLYELGETFDIPFLRFPFLGETATALGAILAAAIWAGAGFFFVILLAGLQQPLVLLIISASGGGVVMFLYSGMLLWMNTRVLPDAIKLKGWRMIAMTIIFLVFAVLSSYLVFWYVKAALTGQL